MNKGASRVPFRLQWKRGGVTGAALVAGALYANPCAAATIHAEPMQGEKIRIDGDLREWPTKMTELSETLSGSQSAGDSRASVVIGYDDAALYVVLKVVDNKIARTAAAGSSEDHATLSLAIPQGGGYTTRDIELYPGAPGKSAGVVKTKGSALKGAKLVEAPIDKGYTIEAMIPWSALPETAKVRVGLRAAVRFTDADSPGSVKAVIGTSGNKVGRGLPPLPFSVEQGLQTLLVKDKGLSPNPTKEVYGNVSGDGMVERVAVYGPYLTIVGPRFRGGTEFYFGELGTESGSQVTRLELEDCDGDGLSEIVIQKRVGSKDEYREILQIMKVGRDDSPFAAFQHEVGIKTKDGYAANSVSVQGGKLEISQGKYDGLDPATYDELLPSGMGATLLPWESTKTRSFKWEGDTFKAAGEASWTPKVAKGQKAGTKPKAAKATAPDQPPPPRPPSADELLDRVYALYKKDRGVGGGKPRYDFVTDVAGDSGPERVVVHDKDLLVFGKGFRAGTSYAFITIGVGEGKDILDVTSRDLSGDGKAEIIVRAVLHAKASKALGGDMVERHALFVYSIQGDALVRVFAAETGRAVGKDRILGTVAFAPGTKGTLIELRPGRAQGWSEKTYPFPEDTTTAGGLEPLLLPWSSASHRRYAWNGSAFAGE
jgi:hypothetical protein